MTSPLPTRLLLVLLMTGLGCHGTARSPAQSDDPPPTPPPTTAAPVQRTPLGTPIAAGCGLPPGEGAGLRCPYNGAAFVEAFDRAIEMAQSEHPELFDFTRCHSPLSCPVPDPVLYEIELVNNLKRQGLCAAIDGEEVAIKNTNAFSDQYQAVTSSGFTRFGIGAYRATCTPAWF